MKRRTNFKDRTGEKYMSNEGYEMTIIKCFSAINNIIMFNDTKNTILYKIPTSRLMKGSVSNPNHPTVCGTGYLGIGKYEPRIKGKQSKNHSKWSSMIKRCYSRKGFENNPTYTNKSVIDEWHDFQIFSEWFEENYIEEWELDKDIIKKGNKLYSPETCCIIPQAINKLFTKRQNDRGKYPIGVHKKGSKFRAMLSKNGDQIPLGTFYTPEEAFECYKFHKEIWIKELADKWKPFIEQRLYIAMYNYEIEITD